MIDYKNDRPRSTSRRTFLGLVGTGILTSAVSLKLQAATRVNSEKVWHSFTQEEVRTLETFGDTLLPGASDAGLADFVDAQLMAENPALILKYMDYTGSFSDFYKVGLASLNAVHTERYDKPFYEGEEAGRNALVEDLVGANPALWKGAPAPLFCFVLRNDALDVYYGTKTGFAELGVPYMAHITPPEKWPRRG
ncbi:gluconate 2-dehydrogenase subunit 3 family protein [Marinobacter orientalis]|uniref:Gluconate 2-dehydrogenase subunit 3 family protein n=1 Tax=Marinobacter orientalis TaxID=1928859 RepID=A0A7Y0NK73_9GAMM|nr:gluconate 2-dehydrogenase subunit 3 family protein [Marinobacter orientalis]NMT62703.1 gluconate 2-dehydrogenase subunit 3 family protein [Marinobacter orientalis]